MAAKNPAAVALGRKRWAKISEADRALHMSSAGRRAWADIPPEERSRILRDRAKKRKKRKKAKS
jgi:delta 1-pyrroline-5-carboxylate dehydrogenase